MMKKLKITNRKIYGVYVLLKQVKSSISQSGLIQLPEEYVRANNKASEIGEIVAMGEDAFLDYKSIPYKIGDTVLVPKYEGYPADDEVDKENNYIVVKDRDIYMKVNYEYVEV